MRRTISKGDKELYFHGSRPCSSPWKIRVFIKRTFVNGYPHCHKITRAEIIVRVNQNRGKYKFNFPGCVFACVRPELTLLLLNVDQLPWSEFNTVTEVSTLRSVSFKRKFPTFAWTTKTKRFTYIFRTFSFHYSYNTLVKGVFVTLASPCQTARKKTR